jgi:hypothetical protein
MDNQHYAFIVLWIINIMLLLYCGLSALCNYCIVDNQHYAIIVLWIINIMQLLYCG